MTHTHHANMGRCTQCEAPPERTTDMTDIPSGYEIRAKDRGGHELLIDGQPFPWAIAADGPRVEGASHGFHHILWVPILINAPMGDGEPDGEPLVTDEATIRETRKP